MAVSKSEDWELRIDTLRANASGSLSDAVVCCWNAFVEAYSHGGAETQSPYVIVEDPDAHYDRAETV